MPTAKKTGADRSLQEIYFHSLSMHCLVLATWPPNPTMQRVTSCSQNWQEGRNLVFFAQSARTIISGWSPLHSLYSQVQDLQRPGTFPPSVVSVSWLDFEVVPDWGTHNVMFAFTVTVSAWLSHLASLWMVILRYFADMTVVSIVLKVKYFPVSCDRQPGTLCRMEGHVHLFSHSASGGKPCCDWVRSRLERLALYTAMLSANILPMK